MTDGDAMLYWWGLMQNSVLEGHELAMHLVTKIRSAASDEDAAIEVINFEAAVRLRALQEESIRNAQR